MAGRSRRTARTCRIQFGTASDQLRDDVIFLVQSLGGVVYRRTRKAEGRKPGLARGREVHHRADAHILDIRLPEGVAPFRLARKAAKYDATGGGRPMRFIDRIEPAGTEEAVCIQVAAADSLYVTEDFLLTHNTLNDAFIILDEAQNTTGEQMKMFLTRLGFGSKIVVTGDITQVDLPGGADLRAARGGAHSRRHRRHPLRRTHQRRRRAASAGVRDRRRLRQIRGARADEPGAAARLGQPAAAIGRAA